MLEKNLRTPALVIDMDIMEQNMKTAKEISEKCGIAICPHYKSNKCVALAKKQLAYGAKCITVAKLEEAEDLIEAGVERVIIGNQITDKEKITRLAYLAGCATVVVCADNAENIDNLETAAAFQGSTIYVYVEYDIGMGRCGVRSYEDVLRLAKLINEKPHLVFDGIEAYAGQLSHEADFEYKKKVTLEKEEDLKKLKKYLEDNGIKVNEVSGISTGTFPLREKGSVYTEAQIGTYLLMESTLDEVGHVPFKPALSVLTQVISTEGGLIIVDAGNKSLGQDQNPAVFLEAPKAEIGFCEEHSIISQNDYKAKIGDRMHLVPGHCCTTMNIYDYVYLVRNGKVEDKIQVTGRGHSR